MPEIGHRVRYYPLDAREHTFDGTYAGINNKSSYEPHLFTDVILNDGDNTYFREWRLTEEDMKNARFEQLDKPLRNSVRNLKATLVAEQRGISEIKHSKHLPSNIASHIGSYLNTNTNKISHYQTLIAHPTLVTKGTKLFAKMD